MKHFDLITRLEAATKQMDENLARIKGCGDGNCIIVRPVGQHTNGGCRCAQDFLKMQRFAFAMNQYRGAIATTLKAHGASHDA